MLKLKRLMGDTLLEKQLEIQKEMFDAAEEEEEQKMEMPDKKRIKVSDKPLFIMKDDVLPAPEDDDEGADQVMEIPATKKKDKKKKKKSSKPETPETTNSISDKRVHFDMSQNKVTEFFKHGKVATRVLG